LCGVIDGRGGWVKKKPPPGKDKGRRGGAQLKGSHGRRLPLLHTKSKTDWLKLTGNSVTHKADEKKGFRRGKTEKQE